jgi:hypothetical protein
MRYLCSCVFLLATTPLFCQPRIKAVDFTGGIGKYEGTLSLLYSYGWRFGQHQKFEFAIAGRFTSYLGQNQYYITAPAELTSGSTGPFVIFKENIPENIDSVLINWPQINALNVAIHLGYQFNSRLSISFNIDAIGFSLGQQKSGRYINGAFGQQTQVTPSAFNLLLISDNDLGSLNSELCARYYWPSQWGIKAGIQFLFTEYSTETEVQQLPEPNDRFRDKSLLLAIGVTKSLSTKK